MTHITINTLSSNLELYVLSFLSLQDKITYKKVARRQLQTGDKAILSAFQTRAASYHLSYETYRLARIILSMDRAESNFVLKISMLYGFGRLAHIFSQCQSLAEMPRRLNQHLAKCCHTYRQSCQEEINKGKTSLKISPIYRQEGDFYTNLFHAFRRGLKFALSGRYSDTHDIQEEIAEISKVNIEQLTELQRGAVVYPNLVDYDIFYTIPYVRSLIEERIKGQRDKILPRAQASLEIISKFYIWMRTSTDELVEPPQIYHIIAPALFREFLVDESLPIDENGYGKAFFRAFSLI